MRGDQHYREAERLLGLLSEFVAPGKPVADAQIHIDAAQVHATLALAAATALGTAQLPVDGPTARLWREAIAVPRSGDAP